MTKKFSYFMAAFLVSGVSLFAQTAESSPPQQKTYMQTIIMLACAALFLYFIILRPEQKRRKKMQEKREAIKPGVKVTAMGIIGTVDSVREDTVILKMIDGAKLEILKAAVTEVEAPEDKTEKAEAKA